MDSKKEEFKKNDYVLLRNPFGSSIIDSFEDEYKVLLTRSEEILKHVFDGGLNLNQFYAKNQSEPIVVPEKHDPLQVCRFEYIAGFSNKIKEIVFNKITCLVDDLMGEPFLLFKDKCNIKKPGGGAFTPHQDIAAYSYFKPKFYVTVAVMLDDSNAENGCLEMARDYKNNAFETESRIDCEFGVFPVFDFYYGGHRNGDIKDEISSQFVWDVIEANKGDVIVFNAFVPHCSKKNISKNQRRNFFFTFSPKVNGNYYQTYYDLKKKDFYNPIFHVSTPTDHNK